MTKRLLAFAFGLALVAGFTFSQETKDTTKKETKIKPMEESTTKKGGKQRGRKHGHSMEKKTAEQKM